MSRTMLLVTILGLAAACGGPAATPTARLPEVRYYEINPA